MVCDGAGSHTATDLSPPENVRILTLPPYSPELNPTEQLWDLIRERRFANKAYDSLDEVEDDLAEELRALEADHTTIQSLTSHQWITSSLNLDSELVSAQGLAVLTLVILAVVAGADRLPPPSVVAIPGDGFLETLLEAHPR